MSGNTDQKIIKSKVGLLNLAEMLDSVPEACKILGYSRDSFYRFKELYEKGGELASKGIVLLCTERYFARNGIFTACADTVRRAFVQAYKQLIHYGSGRIHAKPQRFHQDCRGRGGRAVHQL